MMAPQEFNYDIKFYIHGMYNPYFKDQTKRVMESTCFVQ